MFKTLSATPLAAAYAWLNVTFYAFTAGTAGCFVALFFFVERGSSARVLELAWTCIGVSAVCMLAMTMVSAISGDPGPAGARPRAP